MHWRGNMPESPKAGDGPPAEGDMPSERLLALIEHEWCGPLPPPSALQLYEEIVPGGAARLLQMAEAERAHRFACEAKTLEADIAEGRIGLLLGGALALCSVFLSVMAAHADAHWTLPVALVSVPVLGMVKTLIKGRRDNLKPDESD